MSLSAYVLAQVFNKLVRRNANVEKGFLPSLVLMLVKMHAYVL